MGNIKQIGPILVKKMREESGTTFKIWYGTMVAQKASPGGKLAFARNEQMTDEECGR